MLHWLCVDSAWCVVIVLNVLTHILGRLGPLSTHTALINLNMVSLHMHEGGNTLLFAD